MNNSHYTLEPHAAAAVRQQHNVWSDDDEQKLCTLTLDLNVLKTVTTTMCIRTKRLTGSEVYHSSLSP